MENPAINPEPSSSEPQHTVASLLARHAELGNARNQWKRDMATLSPEDQEELRALVDTSNAVRRVLRKERDGGEVGR